MACPFNDFRCCGFCRWRTKLLIANKKSTVKPRLREMFLAKSSSKCLVFPVELYFARVDIVHRLTFYNACIYHIEVYGSTTKKEKFLCSPCSTMEIIIGRVENCKRFSRPPTVLVTCGWIRSDVAHLEREKRNNRFWIGDIKCKRLGLERDLSIGDVYAREKELHEVFSWKSSFKCLDFPVELYFTLDIVQSFIF